jgi:hypothetical protein
MTIQNIDVDVLSDTPSKFPGANCSQCPQLVTLADINIYTNKVQHFWSRVKIADEQSCWLWEGATNKFGYGVVKIFGKTRRAHCVAYEFTHKISVIGFVVRHTCDNPSCCNPNHLALGTNADNMADKVLKGRHSHNETHGMAKLTNAQVLSIRRLHETGNFTQQELADKFNIGRSRIWDIINNKRWKDV